MEDENTPRGGGGLGRFFSGSRGRLLLIGGGLIAFFVLVKHFAQNIAAVPSAGAPPLGTGTTIYQPTILSGGGGTSGGGGGGTSGGGGGGTSGGGGLSFAQWRYQLFGQHRLSPGGLGATLTNIERDPQLSPQQKAQLIDVVGGGPNPQRHPAGSAAERVAPILPGYAGGR